MRTITYEQIWRVEDYMQDLSRIADRVFLDNQQINWIIQQGYQPRVTKYYAQDQEQIHYQICFDVSDEFLTWLYIKYPADKERIDLEE